ncbi:MAG: methylisocitrate lyase [Actinoplanes sp.]|nr:methylisocitrate lyase [Actinoplanes sp.]
MPIVTAADLRAMLAAHRVTHVPGVYDPASVALAVAAGHRALYLSGAAISATMLGRPDLDFVPATQIADRAAVLGPARGGVPLLADAAGGYDSPEHAVWTALAYQRAGVGGLVLADDRDARPAVERVAALVEQVPQLMLIAQARGRDLDETIERCQAYAAAGADAVLAAGVHGADDVALIGAALPGVHLVVSRSQTVTGGRRGTDAELADLGVRLVLHPLAAVLAALRAASLAYRAIADEGDAERVDRLPLAVLTTLTEAKTTLTEANGIPAGPAMDQIDT